MHVSKTLLTKIGCEDKTIVTMETDKDSETMSLEMLRYPTGYGSDERDVRVRAKITKAEAKLIRGAIEAWIGDEL